MLERTRDHLFAFKIDWEMEKVVKGGVHGRRTSEQWVGGCLTIAKSRRTSQIDLYTYNCLSPATKMLLPEELLIVKTDDNTSCNQF